jgi:hypothetical protein
MLPFGFSVETVLSLSLGLLGITVTIWLSIAAGRRRRPSCSSWSRTLFDQESLGLSGIEMKYRGDVVGRLTASRVILWNGGSEAIARRHLVSADTLRLEHQSSGSILEVGVIKQSHSAIGFAASVASSRAGADCSFVLFDPGQYVVIDILHTGSEMPFIVRGAIEGGGGSWRRVSFGRWNAITKTMGGFFTGALGALSFIVLEALPMHLRLPISLLVALVGGVVTWQASFLGQRFPRSARSFASVPAISKEWRQSEPEGGSVCDGEAEEGSSGLASGRS